MRPCAACGSRFDSAALLLSAQGEVCAPCSASEDEARRGAASPLAMVGLLAGAVPFFASVTSGTTHTIDGQVVSSSVRDYVALGGGAVALAAGALALLAARSAGGSKRRAVAVATVVVLLGAYQLLRGFGVA